MAWGWGWGWGREIAVVDDECETGRVGLRIFAASSTVPADWTNPTERLEKQDSSPKKSFSGISDNPIYMMKVDIVSLQPPP